nr:lachesin-like [Procambarus clarkii]XP_045593469.1 lachesin-like [Procambarus clarkii]
MDGRYTVLFVALALMSLETMKALTLRSENTGSDVEVGGLPRIVGDFHNVTVPLGRDTILPCTVENLQGFKVAWVQVDTQTVLTIHTHVITRNPRISLLHNDNRSWHLYLSNVREKDRGWYMCQVNTDPMRDRQSYLDVVVPPDIIDRESSGDLVIREGDDVTLTCRARGHPTPGVVWRREDSQDVVLEEGRTVGEVVGDTLTMKKVSRLQMGSYLCIAHNGVPPSVSKRTHLTVQFPPMMWVPQQLEGAQLEQQLTIECHTEAFPRSINYWTNPSGEMIVPGPQFEPVTTEDSSYKVHMKLRMLLLHHHDFGRYHCVAKNPLGEANGAVLVYAVEKYENSSRPKGINNLREGLPQGNIEGEETVGQDAPPEGRQSGPVDHRGPAGQESGAMAHRSTTSTQMVVIVLGIGIPILGRASCLHMT